MNIKMKSHNSVTIDGRTFSGRNVVINKNRVIVDGVEQSGELIGPVSITIDGDVESIDGSFTDVTVTGSAGQVKTMSGDVRCGDISGSVSTMSGDITAKEVRGSASSMSGDVRCR